MPITVPAADICIDVVIGCDQLSSGVWILTSPFLSDMSEFKMTSRHVFSSPLFSTLLKKPTAVEFGSRLMVAFSHRVQRKEWRYSLA